MMIASTLPAPEADRTHENQPPDSHVDPAQHIKQAAHQQGEGPQHHAAHDVAGGEESSSANTVAVSVPAKTMAGDADLRKVIAERPVQKSCQTNIRAGSGQSAAGRWSAVRR